jgi:hypothetical protein
METGKGISPLPEKCKKEKEWKLWKLFFECSHDSIFLLRGRGRGLAPRHGLTVRRPAQRERFLSSGRRGEGAGRCLGLLLLRSKPHLAEDLLLQ